MIGEVLRQAWVLSVKDTRTLTRDKFAVGFALAFPLLFVLGFTLALSPLVGEDEDTTVRFTVATQEEAGLGRQIVDSLTAGEDSIFLERPYDEARQAVDDGDLAGFIAFPADFTQSVFAGRATRIDVVAMSESPETAAALRGIASTLASRISLTTAMGQTLARHGADPSSLGNELFASGSRELVSFKSEEAGPEREFGVSDFTLPGYLTMFVFFAAAMAAQGVARERETHTLERMLSNGARRESILLGKYLAAAYLGIAQLAVLWTVGILGFGVNLGPEPVAVIGISVLMVLASAGFGVMLASTVNTVRAANSVGVLASLLLAPLGGCWWPLFIAPQWMQGLARLTPHGWANGAFNKLMLFGAESGDVLF
ncbi:MAG: ABC transporter permease, partial [SAR202 cluster bacterium]|nr:ABC transporter permease [SAR202 cluster bacterium]